MKCKHCDGTGITNWCVNGTFVDCPYCGGTGEMEVEKETINERVKIKCDDCKFEPECADYGWLGCKKFTPAPSEPQTNEDWFCQLPTEEKARWLYDHYVNARADEYYGRQEKTLSEYQKWLVSGHRKTDGTKID